uniref:Protein kinase domain-containing protein n=2 Tax=Hemiselmis andersenii TaxID=464988 RepID=A0A6U4I5J8_HEMAN|mmetsp:Transcript_10221/g.23927  ORF Transcript_10221/g.23927 Transcript_10221/m.23927 type:complete len:530 (-) Transcript_10221:115-1704(-)
MGGAAGKQATIVEEPLALNYDLTKEELGKGVYATIFKGRCRATGAAVAIKVFHKGHRKYDKEAVNEEAAIMRHLTGRNGGKEGTHHSCVRLLGASQDKSAANLVMELVQGGTLNERINPEEPFSEVRAAKITLQMLRAVAYMHSMGVSHRDIKPSNILMVSSDPLSNDYDTVKIADFGFACIDQVTGKKGSSRRGADTVVGTQKYMAPEIALNLARIKAKMNDGEGDEEFRALSGSKTKTEYTNLCDVWSVGVILYVLLTGGMIPFPDRARLVHISYDFSAPPFATVSSLATGLISSILVREPHRPSAEKLLKHEWLGGPKRKGKSLSMPVGGGLPPLSVAGESNQKFQPMTPSPVRATKDGLGPTSPFNVPIHRGGSSSVGHSPQLGVLQTQPLRRVPQANSPHTPIPESNSLSSGLSPLRGPLQGVGNSPALSPDSAGLQVRSPLHSPDEGWMQRAASWKSQSKITEDEDEAGSEGSRGEKFDWRDPEGKRRELKEKGNNVYVGGGGRLSPLRAAVRAIGVAGKMTG